MYLKDIIMIWIELSCSNRKSAADNSNLERNVTLSKTDYLYTL